MLARMKWHSLRTSARAWRSGQHMLQRRQYHLLHAIAWSRACSGSASTCSGSHCVRIRASGATVSIACKFGIVQGCAHAAVARARTVAVWVRQCVYAVVVIACFRECGGIHRAKVCACSGLHRSSVHTFSGNTCSGSRGA